MRKTTALALLLMLALTASADARPPVLAPPGLPEAEQYFQTLPTSTGPRAPDLTRKAHDAVIAGAFNEATERALLRRGRNGLALAEAVAQTSPKSGQGGGNRSASLGSLGEDGLGTVFPLLLVLATAAAAAFAVGRSRLVSR